MSAADRVTRLARRLFNRAARGGGADSPLGVESRVAGDYKWMTIGVMAMATAGGAAEMAHARGRGPRYAALCAAVLAERAWLLWYLATREDADTPRAIGIDAATLAAATIMAARTSDTGEKVDPFGTMVGASSAAYPHLGGSRVGPAAILLLAAAAPVASWLDEPSRERVVAGLSTGLAHLRGYALSYVAARGFRVVVENMAEAARHAEEQKAAEAEALERERLYGIIHDHTLYGLEQIAGPQAPDLDEARKIARIEAERLRLRLGAVESDGGFPWTALATEFARDGLDVDIRVDPGVAPAMWDVETLRVFADALREALRNVVKHSRASHTIVRIGCDGPRVVGEVTDDGIGFDRAVAAPGYGLANRVIGPVETLGGAADVESSPGSGTTVRIELPLGAGH